MRYCPFAHRSVLALIAKNVDYEIVNIDLMNKPEWLKSKSSLGKVPALEISENVCVIESLIVSEYIDEVFPQRKLLPQDPYTKAIDKTIVEMTGPIHSLFFKIIRDTPVTDDALNSFINALTFIENELKKRGTTFLHGNEPGYADYMIWPWFERLPVAAEFDKILSIDEKKFPVLARYLREMENDPVVKAYKIPVEIQKKYFENYRKGETDYELLS
ncbi:pyrimidodiazepine synthase-like isoform X2 [Zerene cesonia]|nr:pyrimidodiazepine synthase-like isoform X2 [Zerene cesonia]